MNELYINPQMILQFTIIQNPSNQKWVVMAACFVNGQFMNQQLMETSSIEECQNFIKKFNFIKI